MATRVHVGSHVHTHGKGKPHKQKEKHEQYDSDSLHSAHPTCESTLSGLTCSVVKGPWMAALQQLIAGGTYSQQVHTGPAMRKGGETMRLKLARADASDA